MQKWVDLQDLLTAGDRLFAEASPERMKMGHGGVWWGVSPCPYGLEKDEKTGVTVCRQAPEDLPEPRKVSTGLQDVSTEEPGL